MKKAILIAVGLIGLAVAACKKDDNGKSATIAQLLTSSTWKYDTIMIDLDKNGTADRPVPSGYIPACQLDNTITFKSDLTGITDEGATKCNDSLPQSTPFTWVLKNGDSTLTITGNSDVQLNGDIVIKSITNTSMVLIKNVTITNPITINANAIITLKK
jgi:hypothetical protein